MKLVKESGIGSGFVPGQPYSCIFQTDDRCCAVIAGERKMLRCKDNSAEKFDLSRPYIKINTGLNDVSFYGYVLLNQRNDLELYCLDENFRETDCFGVRLEGIGRLTDLWVDSCNKILYLVHNGSIEKYNLNGDYLGRFMKASPATKYWAMCTAAESVFLAYERNGCDYIAHYARDGGFHNQLSLGSGFQVLNVSPTCECPQGNLSVYAVKKGGIFVCLSVDTELEEKPEAIRLQFIKGDGIGEVTCNLKSQEACH